VNAALSIGAAFCAFLAAIVWRLGSTELPPPPAGGFAEAIMPAMDKYQKAARRSSSLNKRAAALAILSAFLGVVAAVLTAKGQGCG
jgi:hypothetical protein